MVREKILFFIKNVYNVYDKKYRAYHYLDLAHLRYIYMVHSHCTRTNILSFTSRAVGSIESVQKCVHVVHIFSLVTKDKFLKYVCAKYKDKLQQKMMVYLLYVVTYKQFIDINNNKNHHIYHQIKKKNVLSNDIVISPLKHQVLKIKRISNRLINDKNKSN